MDNDTTAPDEANGTSTSTDERSATADPSTAGHDDGSGPRQGEPKRLVRDTRSAVLGGVAAGLGRYLGLDPILIRLGFIVLALTGGIGIVAYIIAWVIVPADDGSTEPAEEMRRAAESVPTWVQVVAVLLVALFLFGQLGGFPGSVAWAAVLIGAGILLFRDADRAPVSPPSAGGAGAAGCGGAAGSGGSGAAAAAGGAAAGGAAAGGAAAGGAAGAGRAGIGAAGQWGMTSSGGSGSVPPPPYDAPGTTVSAAPDARPRPPSILGRLTIAVLLVWTGVAALLDNIGAVDLAPRQYVAMALIIVGGALVIGTWWGHGRALIVLGLALLPVLLLAGFPTDAIRGGVGERVYAPQTITDVAPGYELFAGTMTIDLSALRPTGDALNIRARHGLGELVIIVPPGVDVVADGWIIAGEATVLDRVENGVGVEYSHRVTTPNARGEVRLDVRQGLGTLVVRHAR
jgi:phage shock protein PspC (stress-responsive transcriptional regulator)